VVDEGKERKPAVLRGFRLDADHEAGRPDLGILCVQEAGGRDRWLHHGLTTVGRAQLRHDLGLDLPDPLPGDAVDLADLIKGLGWPSVSPNRIDTTPASRSESVSSTECSCSCSSVKLTASPGWMASESCSFSMISLQRPTHSLQM